MTMLIYDMIDMYTFYITIDGLYTYLAVAHQ